MFFETVAEGAPDPVFGLLGAYQADPRPDKMSLMVGVFKDEHLKCPILPSVQEHIAGLEVGDYLPIDGLDEFCERVGRLCFGSKLWEAHQGRIYGAQCVGGTGALRVGAEFLGKELGRQVWIPNPTWPNHRSVFQNSGLNVEILPYYHEKLNSFDRDGYLAKLKTLAPRSIVLFHAVCHNPTGSDPTLEDWEEIMHVCKARSLFPFFDFAYQGFGDGMEEDGRIVRMFLEQGFEMLVAYSCSKNFSLYRQRVGALYAVALNGGAKARVGSQIKKIIRALYSNPPAFGAAIVAKLLSDPKAESKWRSEVELMRNRIKEMRTLLLHALDERGGHVDFRFILRHKGMFSYLGLNKIQVSRLLDEFAIYTLDHGRVNMAGFTKKNINYFADALIQVCRS